MDVPPPAAPDAGPGPDPAPFALLERVEVEFGRVDDALHRLDEGTYGRCDTCEAELDDDQLTADPLARRCPTHGSPGT